MKQAVVLIFLCINHFTVSATQPLHARHAETEAGQLPVDWNAQLEEKLIRELSKNNLEAVESLPESLELELEVPKEGKEDDVPIERLQGLDAASETYFGEGAKPVPIPNFGEPNVVQKKGQPEYMSFVDLSPSNAARKVEESPVAEVKRANEDSINIQQNPSSFKDSIFMVTVVGGVACALVGVVVAAVVVRRLHRVHSSARESEYPQYGVTGPGKDKKAGGATGDAIGAYNAQLAHYKETKQKIISMEQSGHENRDHESDDSDGEQEEGDFSVYECPGLAPTGDIEVSNPMFENSNGSPKTKDSGSNDGD